MTMAGGWRNTSGTEATRQPFIVSDRDNNDNTGRVTHMPTLDDSDLLTASTREWARVAELFEWSPGFVCLLKGPDHIIEYVNRNHRKLFDSESWVGQPARVAVPSVTAQGFHDLLDTVFRTGERYQGTNLPVTYRQAPDAPETTIYHDFIYEPIRAADGSVTGILCEGFDVTMSRLAQGKLERHSERQAFRLGLEESLAEARDVSQCMLAAVGLICQRWNVREIGFIEEAVDGVVLRRVYQFPSGQFRMEVFDALPFSQSDTELLRAGVPLLKSDSQRSDSIVVPRFAPGASLGCLELTEVNMSIDEDEIAFLGDVGRRAWAAIDRIKAQVERDRFFQHSLDLLCVARLSDMRIRRASHSFETILGWTADELVGTSSMDLIHPEDRHLAQQQREPLSEGSPLRTFEQRVRCKDGSYRWISWNSIAIAEEDLIYGVGRDVTERKAFERDRDAFIAELNHRVRNNLAVVQALASEAFRSSGETGSVSRENFAKQISTLASVHDLLTDSNWSTVLLNDVIGLMVTKNRYPYPIKCIGPAVQLKPREAITVALIVNELVTKSSIGADQGGALPSAAANWKCDDGALLFSWFITNRNKKDLGNERPSSHRLLTALASDLDGKWTIDRTGNGTHYLLEARVAQTFPLADTDVPFNESKLSKVTPRAL